MRNLLLISAAVAALAVPGQAGSIAELNGAGGHEPARGMPSTGSDPHVKTQLACYPKCGHVAGFRRDEVRGILL
jgi:hypothetical protein